MTLDSINISCILINPNYKNPQLIREIIGEHSTSTIFFGQGLSDKVQEFATVSLSPTLPSISIIKIQEKTEPENQEPEQEKPNKDPLTAVQPPVLPFSLIRLMINIESLAVIIYCVSTYLLRNDVNSNSDFLLNVQLSSQMVICIISICLIPTLADWLTKKQTQQSNILARSLVEIILLVTFILGFSIWVFGLSILKKEWIIYSTVLIVILEAGSSIIEYRKTQICKDLRKKFPKQEENIKTFFETGKYIYIPVPFSLIIGTICIWLVDDTHEVIILSSLKLFLIVFLLFIFCFLCLESYKMGDPLFGIGDVSSRTIKLEQKNGFPIERMRIPEKTKQYSEEDCIKLAQDVTEIRKIYWYDAVHNTILLIGLIIVLDWILEINPSLIEWSVSLSVFVLLFDLLPYACGQQVLHDKILQWYPKEWYSEEHRERIFKELRKNAPRYPLSYSLQETTETMTEQSKYDQRGATINIGQYIDTAEPGSRQESQFSQYNYTPEQKQTAKDIQELLEQLEKSYLTKKLSEKAIVAEKALEKIEANKNWKTRVIDSVKAMGIETFMEMIDHPIANVLRAGIESWIKEDSD